MNFKQKLKESYNQSDTLTENFFKKIENYINSNSDLKYLLRFITYPFLWTLFILFNITLYNNLLSDYFLKYNIYIQDYFDFYMIILLILLSLRFILLIFQAIFDFTNNNKLEEENFENLDKIYSLELENSYLKHKLSKNHELHNNT